MSCVWTGYPERASCVRVQGRPDPPDRDIPALRQGGTMPCRPYLRPGRTMPGIPHLTWWGVILLMLLLTSSRGHALDVWIDGNEIEQFTGEETLYSLQSRPTPSPQQAYQRGHGAIVKTRRSADVAACRAVSNPAWCRIFREISCFSPLNLGTLLRCCVLGQGTSPSNASLDSGENEYPVGQRWQCVR